MLNPTLIGAAALLRLILPYFVLGGNLFHIFGGSYSSAYVPYALLFHSISQDSGGPAWVFRSLGNPIDCELTSGGGEYYSLNKKDQLDWSMTTNHSTGGSCECHRPAFASFRFSLSIAIAISLANSCYNVWWISMLGCSQPPDSLTISQMLNIRFSQILLSHPRNLLLQNSPSSQNLTTLLQNTQLLLLFVPR